MKKVVATEVKETVNINDLSNKSHVGFIDRAGNKGYICYIGNNKGTPQFSTISTNSDSMCNHTYGGIPDNRHSTIKEVLHIRYQSGSGVAEAYVFDTIKELHLWLGE